MNNTIEAEAIAYNKVSQVLGFNSSQLLEYIYYSNLEKQGLATLIVGQTGSNLILNLNNK